MNLKRMGILLGTIVGLSQAMGSAFAQNLATATPAFEVASIRHSGPQSRRGEDGGPGKKDPVLYRYDVATLQDLITTAWNVDPFQISSATSLDKQNFDLSARVPEGATREQFRAMLRNLLAERFGLKTHVESRQFEAYELVVAKSGLKLKEAVPGEAAPQKGGVSDLPLNRPGMSSNASFSDGVQVVHVKAQLEPLSALARLLPREDRLPVIDKTGVSGVYSFALDYTTELSVATPDGPALAPDIFTALQQQLGLQLVRTKLPFDVVVVEAFHQQPTEN